MKKIFAAVVVILILCSCSAKPASANLERYSADIAGVFDTVVNFTAYCENRKDFEKIYAEVSEKFSQMDRLFDCENNYPDTVNVKTINDSAGKTPVDVDKRLARLLEYACEIHKKTDGKVKAFTGGASELIVNTDRSAVFLADPDCSVNTEAFALGFAVDEIKSFLDKKKIKKYVINCGGMLELEADKDAQTACVQYRSSAMTVICGSCADACALARVLLLTDNKEGGIIAEKFGARVIRH